MKFLSGLSIITPWFVRIISNFLWFSSTSTSNGPISELKRSWLGKRLLSQSISDLFCTLSRFLEWSSTSKHVFLLLLLLFCIFVTNPSISRPHLVKSSDMLTSVLIKRLTICCFSPKWTSFISDLGAVTVDSGSQILVIFTKSDQFHQRVRGGNCGSRVPKIGPFSNLCRLRQSDAILLLHHLRRFAPLLCRVLSSIWH